MPLFPANTTPETPDEMRFLVTRLYENIATLEKAIRELQAKEPTSTPVAQGTDGNIAIFGTKPNFQGLDRGLFLDNAYKAPTAAPAGGGFFYSLGGVLHWYGVNGLTPIGIWTRTGTNVYPRTITDTLSIGTATVVGKVTVEVDGGVSIISNRSYGSSPASDYYAADGTLALPSAIASGRQLALIRGWGWDGSAFDFNVAIDMRTTELWSSTANGTDIRFRVTPSGSTTMAEIARLTSTGLAIGVGAAASAKLHVRSTTVQKRLDYDANNYVTETVSGTGATAFAIVSNNGTPKFSFDKGVDVTGNSSVTGTLDVTSTFNKVKIAYKTADETVNNSTTYQDDDHLTLPVEANSVYHFSLNVLGVTNNATPEIKFQFTAPASSNGACTYLVPTTNSSTFYNGVIAYGAAPIIVAPAVNSWGAIFTTVPLKAEGILVTAGTAGSFTVQWAQRVANASDTKWLTGSSLTLIKQ